MWDGESGLRKEGLCPLRVRQVFVAGDGPEEKKKKDTGKRYYLVFVPLTSVPKEKNGELFERLIFANIVNAI